MSQPLLRCRTTEPWSLNRTAPENPVLPGHSTKSKTMNRNFSLFALLMGLANAIQAAVPPPEKLLPADTLGVFTVPDYAKARAAYEANASSQLWRDPAMKPFTGKLMNKVKEEFITPLERQLG